MAALSEKLLLHPKHLTFVLFLPLAVLCADSVLFAASRPTDHMEEAKVVMTIPRNRFRRSIVHKSFFAAQLISIEVHGH